MLDHEPAMTAVLGVIQRTYNDASQTVLDRQCATAILEELRELGWCSPMEAALLMLGKRTEKENGQVDITIPVDMVMELSPGQWTIERWKNRDQMEVTMRIRRTS